MIRRYLAILILVLTGLCAANAQDVTIPADLLVSRSSRLEHHLIERDPVALNALSDGSLHQVFPAPPCLTGSYYVGVQLFYDLGDSETQQDWRADLSISLLNGTTVLWTRPLGVRMHDQTFISTTFHTALLTCSADYSIRIESKSTEGAVPGDNIYLKILLHKYMNDSFTVATTAPLNCTADQDRAFVSWTYTGNGVYAYDLEWVFIADYENFTGTTPQQAFAFKEPVRITTAARYYRHFIYYPKGRIWYRIRAVGFNRSYPEHRIPGAWSYTGGGPLIIENRQPDRNWQLQTVFAEEGTYKKIVSYFDGTYRQRQVQTSLSSRGDTTVVGETLYDFEGRPAVNLLAVPTALTSLSYRANFNGFQTQHTTVASNTSAKRKKFHFDNDNLANSIVSAVTGAGYYYSASNNLKTLHREYVPDAEGYVYSQTEYLNDGTGRVRRSSGVGKEFRMDGARTTQNYYGNANTEELIRLFGSNVGNALHYKKNLTVDPNGQASVSYMDQESRVIATALAGTNPVNVTPLASLSSLPTDNITINLASKNVKRDAQSIIEHKILNPAANASYLFQYDLSAIGSEIEGVGCIECTYNLRITVTDPTGKLMTLPSAIPGNEDGSRLSFLRTGITTDTECSSPDVENTVSFSLTLGIGEYTVTKVLTPLELSFDDFKTKLFSNGSIETKIQQIRDSYVVDAGNCDICTEDPATNAVCPEAEQYINEAILEIADLDCENIYRNIIEKIRRAVDDPTYDPELPEIEGHADYCKYQRCMEDRPSHIFEMKISRIYTWNDAAALGYVAAMSNVQTTTPVSDPFFTNGNGQNMRSQMQSRLNAVTVPTAGIPLPNGPYQGTILQITDPANTNYYITDDGQRNASGNHVLYIDLMKRWKSGQISLQTYNAELALQRWVMFRMFYLEAKRKTKLQMALYTGCPTALEELQRTDNLPQNQQDIAAWGATQGITDGATGPVSDEELEALVGNMQFHCSQTISEPHKQTITNHLREYFNTDQSNFLRLIYQSDINSGNSNLLSIQTILSTNYGCSMDSLITTHRLVCKKDTVIYLGQGGNLIRNAAVAPSQGSCSFPLNSTCYDGWHNPQGTPLRTSPGEIFLSGSCCNPNPNAATARGSFLAPLIPGKTYRMCFSYRASPVNYGVVRMDLSSSTAFYPANCTVAYSLPPSEESRQQDISPMSYPYCGYPTGRPDQDLVIVNGNSQMGLWYASPTNSGYVSTCIEFTPTQASTYFYITAWSELSTSAGLYLKDFSLIQTDADSVSLVSVCKEYYPMKGFEFDGDWSGAVQRCLDNAQVEREYLIGYAIDKLLDEEATLFYNQASTNCLGNAAESLKYTYAPKEYHYTLYYFDQAGNLVQTVPPEGVNPLSPSQVQDFLSGNKSEPLHRLTTRYQYNSLNQMLWQKTPDAGESQFWYNDKGQLRLSQNAQQEKDQSYSYSKYDALSRIVEVGEMSSISPLSTLLTLLEQPDFPSASDATLSDITRTFYDLPNSAIAASFPQENLRSRVSWTEMLEKGATAAVITYYSYDIHGNVKSVVQQIPELGNKRTDYKYDLVSGNVKFVMYQLGQPDQFIHQYTYDSDNRIQTVRTSVDGYMFNQEAKYQYYLHGPLARVELGEYRVQGVDYYYTLQGWIKGVNNPFAGDPGKDGQAQGNREVGKDVFSYTLGYFENDYKPIIAGTIHPDTRDQIWARYKTQMGTTNLGLFNGNIAWMITDLKKVGDDKGSRSKGLQAMLYKYDQLHRIVQSRSLVNYIPGSGFGTRTLNAAPYDEDYSYDANGNIKTLKRQNHYGALTDDFQYSYYTGTNKLRYHKAVLRDTTYSGAVASTNKLYRRVTLEGTAYAPSGKDVVIKAIENIDFDEGFSVQPNATFRGYIISDDDGAYVYDAIGNLVHDQENGVRIFWTPYGKVRRVEKDDGTQVSFLYDATGNRVEKKVTKPDNTVSITRYVRDASGNVMGVYSRRSLIETPIYGSSRVGMYKGGNPKAQRKLGARFYELSNHLGNVLSVISDNIGMNADSTWAKVINASDYYPFGLTMPGRNSSLGDAGNRALQLSGVVVADNDKILSEISNNFTVELWVNPTTTHQVDAQTTSGTGGMSGQKYVIHPAYGGAAATGEAGMGISVGTNGVSVYEHAASYMPPILSWSGTVTGWTHIAVVYVNKQPRLYVNGTLVKTGATSPKTLVHPSYGFMGGQYGTMNGLVDEIRIWNISRSAQDIQDNYNKLIKRNAPNLAGYWAMNENYGLVVRDLSGHGLDQPTNAAVQWAGLNTGAPVSAVADAPPSTTSSLRLSGTTYSDSKMIFGVSNTFTVELWVKPTTTHQVDGQSTSGTGGTSGQRYVINPVSGGASTTGQAGMGISVGTNGISVYEHATSYMPAILSWSGTVSGWTHIAIVYNNKQPSLYINGQFVKTGLISPKTFVHPGYGFLGGLYGTFPGWIDELRIWSVARTAVEIAENYNKAIDGNPSSLVGYWPMNETGGSYVYDITGNGLTRELGNGAIWATESSGIQTPVNDPENGVAYRYGFNGKEKDDKGEWGNTYYDYGFRIYNPSIGKFLSVDPLTKGYPMLTPYQFASNRPIDGIDLDGLEYLGVNEAKVEVISGTLFIKLENFSSVFQTFYRRDNPLVGLIYKDGDGIAYGQGMLATIILPQKPELKEGRLSNKTNDPSYNPAEVKLTPANRFTRRLYSRGKVKPPTLRTGSGSRGAAGATIVFNAITFSLSYYMNSTINEEVGELSAQTNDRTILEGFIFNERWVTIEAPLNKALKDVLTGLDEGRIPEEHLNIDDLSSIVNIVLFGGNGKESESIKKVGQNIIKNISEREKKKNDKKETTDNKSN